MIEIRDEISFLSGAENEWTDGYVFHGDADRVFRDFFGGDNPFAG